MDDNRTSQPIDILLSRKELQVVLNLLDTEFLPGLDADPLGDLTAAQQSLALTVARHALQARELAQVQADGQLVIHNKLLTAVGVCAYSQKTIFVYHWPAKAETPIRYFGHLLADDIVAHTRPQDVLHLFSILPSKEQLVAQVLEVCEYKARPDSPVLELTLSGEDLATVRELATVGQTKKAVELLVNPEVSPETAESFVKTLADSPRVSIMQTLKHEGTESIQKRDFTLLQNSHDAWLVIAPSGETTAAPLRVKTTTKHEIQTLLTEWL